MSANSDLVRLSKLDAQISEDLQVTRHAYKSTHPGRRGLPREEMWRRRKQLGRGAFGDVYKEECIEGSKKGEFRAVKSLRKPESSNYYRELEAVALFSHEKYQDYFVRSFGWYEKEDNIFLSMEYLHHGDLQKHLKGPLPEQEGQQIVHQVLEGLQFMHEFGFAHRDLKPANIMVVEKSPAWWVKIADLGISKRASEGDTVLRTFTGTRAFMAPEVFTDLFGFGEDIESATQNGFYTNSVDVWAAGVITFLLLTGQTPFEDARMLRRHATGNMDLISHVLKAKGISTAGQSFAESLMAPKPEQRPSAKDCLKHAWLEASVEPLQTKRKSFEHTVTSMFSLGLKSEPLASWDTVQSDTPPPGAGQNIFGNPVDAREEREETLKLPAEKCRANADAQPELVRLKDAKAHPGSSTPIVGTGPGGAVTESDRLKASAKAVLLQRAAALSGKKTDTERPDKDIANDGQQPIRVTATKYEWTQVLSLGHADEVTDVTFSPNGNLVASSSLDGSIRVFDGATGALQHTLTNNSRLLKGRAAVWGVAFSPDSLLIASASTDKTVKLWDVSTGTVSRVLGNQKGRISAAVFSPNGKLVASASREGIVRVYHTSTGLQQRTLDHGHCEVYGIAFAPDGKSLASSALSYVWLWDITTGDLLYQLKGHTNEVVAVTFSPVGDLLASTSADKTVRLWNMRTRATWKVLDGYLGAVTGVAFSPDGKLLASSSHHKTVKLWGVTAGTVQEMRNGHSDTVYAVAFSPDGNTLASASRDRTMRLWKRTPVTQ